MDKSEIEEALLARIDRLERQVALLSAGQGDLPPEIVSAIASGDNPVRAIRRWRLMTQKELADQAFIGVNHVSRIENGAQFNMRTARALASALKVRIDDIS